MSARLRWVLVALVLVVAGAIAVWPRSTPTAAAPPVATPVRTSLPSCARQGVGPQAVQGLTATCLADGGTVDVRQTLAGPVLINVWATWCGPCQDELPVLADYARQPGSIPVMEVAVQSDQSTAVAMLTNLAVNLPSLFDRDGAVERALKVPTLPSSYLVDAQGNIRVVTDPQVFGSVDAVRKAVDQ